jgi:hypothetical protein
MLFVNTALELTFSRSHSSRAENSKGAITGL